MESAIADYSTHIILIAIVFFGVSFFSISIGLCLVVAAMLFSPEFGIEMSGGVPIKIRIEDLLIPVLIMAWVAKTSVEKGTSLFIKTPLNKPIACLLVCSLVSTVWGSMTGWVSFSAGLFYLLKTLEFFIIFYLVANFIKTETQIRLFLNAMICVFGFIGLYTIFQVPQTEIFTVNRITAPFEGAPEPATIGGYMAFLLLIILSLFLFETKKAQRCLYAIVGILVLIPFCYTLNRTSYIAFLVGLVFIAFHARNKSLNITLIILLFLSPIILPEAVKERIAFTWLDASGPGRVLGVDQSFQERIFAWTKMWHTWKKSPFIGWGLTSFMNPDSQYARTLHEIGIIGLSVWLWIYWRLYKISRWLFRTESRGLKGLALGYWGGMIAVLCHGFGAVTFYIVRIMEPFWFISGIIMSLYLIRIRQMEHAE